jgi:flagellar basal-body rod protein FlgB
MRHVDSRDRPAQGYRRQLDYLGQRHKVIAENIANADTPGYKPKDLTPVDFGSVLSGVTGAWACSPRRPTPCIWPVGRRRGGRRMTASRKLSTSRPRRQRGGDGGTALQRGPHVMDYNLMLNLYQKQIGMMKIALGVR